MKKIKLYFQQLFCKHIFNSDTQIRVIKCEKCGEKHWIKEYKNLY